MKMQKLKGLWIPVEDEIIKPKDKLINELYQ